MFGSALLDVAIGMVFVFLLLSLICSAFNELLETRLKNRAGDLEKGIKGLLGANTGLVDKLYNHGLIFSLFRGTYAEAARNKTLPSYIPSQDFANAVASILGPAAGNIPSAADIRNSINQIANEQVKSALLTLLNDAHDDLEKFRAGLEAWFNSAMDRVSGWYKRRAHVIIFACAFLIAVAMNVNSIALAQDLWTNQAKREALVGAAQGFLDKHPASSTTANSSAAVATPALDQGLKADIEELKSTNVPIGWSREGLQIMGCRPLMWLGALLGWFLTACAASLGAPFWFDVLGKIIVVRSSIKPGEKSAPAASKS
ncbi:MAG TPA: hypothetical protein VKP58_07305 [Candidatus Acidoferrum sp.]|nr:hypothetical protein [Candidatus Acidoferrum sp.]